MKQLLNLHIDFVKNFKNTQYLDSHIYKGIDEEILQNSKRYEKVYPNKLVVIIKNNVPHIKRNLPIITILLYFIGFIVYTTHQESYKIHAFELLNGQYLKSGLLFSFIFLPPFLLNLYTQIEFHKISANRFMSRVFGVGMVIYYVTIICSIVITIVELSTAKLLIAGIFFTFLTLYFRFLVFSPYGNVVFLTSLAPIAGYLIYLLLGVSKWYSLLIGITLYYHWEIIYDIQVILKEEFRNAVILTRPVFLTLLYVSIFGYFFYKHIPRVLGGGSPSEQKIIVNSNAFSDNDYLKKLVAVNQQNVISVTVVLETNDEYFISLGDSSVLAFSKNLTVGKLNKVKNFEEYFN